MDVKGFDKARWQEVKSATVGHVFIDRIENGVRFIVLRGPFHLCAYLGVPHDHPLAGHSYDNLTISCHGGLTFGKAGDDKYLPADRFWYGWDYGHYDDYMICDSHSPDYAEFNETRQKWTPEMVDDDSWGARYDFGRLMRLAEEIMAKTLKWRGSSTASPGM